jgi:hypothetical protein
MLSFITPAPISLIFAAMKPQVGIGIAIFWFFEAWRMGGVREVLKTFAPVTFLLGISFAMYGFWVLTYSGKWNTPVNVSLFPYLLPLGIYMLYVKQKQAAMASCICLSPYYTFFGLSAPLVALFQYPRLMFIGWAVLWLYPLLRILIL